MRIVDIPMDPEKNDAEASTIGEYLVKLLSTLIHKQEAFSGKRPFGNSDWIYDLIYPMVKAGVINGTFNTEWDEVDNYDEEEFYSKMELALKELYYTHE